ncbi:MAG: hypothetical protein PHG23_02305 [Candidatus Pacebacteria bacterium]|nr:hypothetical protein [Candidatus Paceibacterota bacterium]
MEEYTKEFFWSVYKTLPEDLKEAIFSERNNEVIYNICSKLNLDEEKTSIVAKYTGRVLMGLLDLDDFPVTLELELNIDETLANKISAEINNNIFKHLRVSLMKLEEKKNLGKHFPQLFGALNDGAAYKQVAAAQEKRKKAEEEKKKLEKQKIFEKRLLESIAFPEIARLEDLVNAEPIIESMAMDVTVPVASVSAQPEKINFAAPETAPREPNKLPSLDDLKGLAQAYEDLRTPAEQKIDSFQNINPVNLEPRPDKSVKPEGPVNSASAAGSQDPYRETPL